MVNENLLLLPTISSFNISDDDSDGDYFEIDPDGNIRLKAGKKKIDISKLSEEQLRQLGIDLKTMSKEEIARILKVGLMFILVSFCKIQLRIISHNFDCKKLQR